MPSSEDKTSPEIEKLDRELRWARAARTLAARFGAAPLSIRVTDYLWAHRVRHGYLLSLSRELRSPAIVYDRTLGPLFCETPEGKRVVRGFSFANHFIDVIHEETAQRIVFGWREVFNLLGEDPEVYAALFDSEREDV